MSNFVKLVYTGTVILIVTLFFLMLIGVFLCPMLALVSSIAFVTVMSLVLVFLSIMLVYKIWH